MRPPLRPFDRQVDRVIGVVLRLFLGLFVATLPGSSVRPVIYERVAPPLPPEVRDRDASVDVQVEAPDHTPIAHARVRALAVLDRNVHLAGEAATDAHGHATIGKLPRAAHWIVADAPGHARGATMVVLAGESRAVTLTLGPEHSLDVEVHDDHGTPLNSAEIEIVAADPLPLGARTGADGKAHVGRLSAGPFIVTARAAGYEEISRHGVVENEVARFVLRRLGAIVVHVEGDHGEAVAGARVQIAGAELGFSRATTTDAAGDVRIAALPDGGYSLRASKESKVSPIELDVPISGGDEKRMTLTLQQGAFVVVRVVEEGVDAEPIEGAAVTVAESGVSPFPLEAVSDKTGSARIGPILPLFATVSARAESFVAPGALTLPDPLPAEIPIVLTRAGVLEGRVVDARGFPIDGATLEVVGTDYSGAPIDDDPRHRAFRAAHFAFGLGGSAPLVPMGELGVVPGPVPAIPHLGSGSVPSANSTAGLPPVVPWVTRDDGTFKIEPVSPGRVRVVVRHPQFVETMSDVVALKSGGTAHVDVVMHAGGALEGKVVDSVGRTVAGARVTVNATRGALEQSVMSGDDGSFAFAALPLDISIGVAAPEDPIRVVARISLTIPELAKKAITLTLPEPRKQLDLQVVDDRGYPLDAVQIAVLSLDPSSPLRTTTFTDARGEAHVANALGLQLRLELSLPGHAPKIASLDANAADTRIVMMRSETATGEVRSTRGAPIAGATITLFTQSGARRGLTNASGIFLIDGLAAGPARLRVRAPGFAPVERDVAIENRSGARPTDLPRVELEEEAVVEGIVVDGKGDPVQGARVSKGTAATYLATGAATPDVAVTDRTGKFRLSGLAAGAASLEAYAADSGRGRADGVKLTSGRTTSNVRIVLGSEKPTAESNASGGVAVTLGVSNADEIVIVDVAEGSAAERGGIAPGDVVLEVDGAKVKTMAAARAKLNGPLVDDVVVRIRRGDVESALRIERETVRR
ncbi:MAG: carboxypeptidase regulatory-like domain-containing protein [Polyangiaceae bacterium]